jgi:hypothetical protein
LRRLEEGGDIGERAGGKRVMERRQRSESGKMRRGHDDDSEESAETS